MLYRVIAIAAIAAALYKIAAKLLSRQPLEQSSSRVVHKMRRCGSCGSHVVVNSDIADDADFRCGNCAGSNRPG